MERVILVGTNDGIAAIGLDLPRMPAGRSIDHLAVTEQGIWALADRTTVWHDPGAGDGRPVASAENATANCLLPADGRLLIGASEARLFELIDERLQPMAAFDETPGRSEWHTPWGGPPDVRSMAVGVEGNLYVNVHVGGVVRSTDGGETWSATMDIDADVHEVIADPYRPHHAHVAAAIGLGATSDGGASWRFTTAGMHASYCRAVAVSESSIFVSVSSGPSGRRAGLYRRPHGADVPLIRCGDGLPEWFSSNLDTFCLAARGRVVVAADAAGAVFSSTDDGVTWSTVAEDLPGVNCVAIV